MITLPATAQNNSSGHSKKKQQKANHQETREGEQEEEDPFPLRRFEYGLNFGAYFADKNCANFYNGIPTNVNTVNSIMTNYYYYQEIKRALNSIDTVLIDGYPTNMHYNVAFSGGLFLRINFNRKNSIFLQANYAQLRAADVVTLNVDPDPYSLQLKNLYQAPVIGKEGRVMIDLGYQRSFPLKSRINLFVQAGATMCYTQVIKSIFAVMGKEYSIVNIYGPGGYQQGVNQQTFYVNQNKFGFGGFLGVGAGIPLNDNFGIEPGFFAHYYPTNLERYTDFQLSFGIYLRILLHFSSPQE